MKIETLFFLLGILLVFGACQQDNDPQIITNVADEFRITPGENIDENQRNFTLHFESIRLQDCENYAVNVNYRKTANDDLILNINNIDLNGASCEEGVASAEGTVELETLAAGNYDILISLQEAIVNKGVLKVSDFDYQLEMETDYGFELTHDKLLRVPPATVWGYIGYTNVIGGPSTSIFDDFVNEFQNYTTDANITAGYYGHFDWDGRTSADGTLSISIPNGTGLTFFRPFVFGYQDNMRSLRALAANFLNSSNDPRLQIRLFTSEGDVFLTNNSTATK